jgi:hypothetical protein
VLLETISQPFARCRTVNATDASFPSKIPTGTEPTGTGSTATGASVLNLGYGGRLTQNQVLLVPYGIGDDNDVFNLRVIGWRVVGNDSQTWLWVPVILAQFVCTMSTQVGVAGRDVLNTERFCDTITLTTGNDDVSVDITSPTGDVIAHASVDLKGSQKLELTFAMSTGSPTSANCLIALI